MQPLLRRAMAAVFVSFLSAAGPCAADEAGAPIVPRTEARLRVDGVLEEAWDAAADVGPLTQREPDEGGPPSEETRVLLLRDADHLYVAVVCGDSRPEAVIGTVTARDADLGPDDTVEIVLDTFRDRRNGYYFQTNPLGAQADGLIAGNGEPDRQWDGIWYARATRSDRGWVAEIAIPAKTVNFDPGQDTWGFNVQRTVKRKQETVRWRAARQSVRLAQVSEAGPLSGLAGLRQGRGLDVRPYLAMRRNRSGAAAFDSQPDLGLDVVYNLTPRLTATATVNTDFAETEVDARLINLTRFSPFFPEKRGFFLQNANVFQTAGQGGAAGHPEDTDLLPLFTRRIGLSPEGEPLPILAGAKLAGRMGPWEVGLIDVHTDRAGAVAPANFLAGRVSRHLGRQSFVGGLFTHGSPEGAPRPLVGIDGRYSRSDFLGSRNLVVDGAVYRVLGAATSGGETWAGLLSADYANDPLNVNVGFKTIGRAFDPGLGFVPRTGIVKGVYTVELFQRPRRWGIRHQLWQASLETVHARGGELLDWRLFSAPVNVRTESGEHFEWNWVPSSELLTEPFAIRPGVVVPPGRYRGSRYRAQVETANKRRAVAGVSLTYGHFYGGRRTDLAATVRLKPSRHLALQLGLTRNEVDLAAARFTTRVWQARVDWAFSPALIINNFLQYDNVSRVAGLNTRLRWTPRQGNDLFVVLNLGRRQHEGRWDPVYDQATAKVQYAFRF